LLGQLLLEALESDLSDLWEEAMKKELESIYKHETWEVATPPRDAHPITTKWVFTIKRDSHGQFVKCKARLVVRGFQQLEGKDFKEIFSPVVKAERLEPSCPLQLLRTWKFIRSV
jgi:hypothetical protein